MPFITRLCLTMLTCQSNVLITDKCLSMEPAIIDIKMNSVGIINSILSAQVLRYCVCMYLISYFDQCCDGMLFFFMLSEFDTNSIMYFIKRRVKRDTNLTKETILMINAC